MELFKLLGTIAIDSDGAMSDMDKVVSGAKSKGEGLSSALGTIASTIGKTAVAAVTAATTGLVALTKSALQSAGELEQNMGGSEAVFQDYAGQMQRTAETAYTNMGLSASDYLATANKMGALLQGSGFSIAESADLSSKAMQRAADVASIMGIDVTSAMESVAGAAKGNFTMMDNLGVAINDTTLQIYAQEKGLGKLETTQDKVSAALQMFLEKTEYATGNYAKENETLAGSLTTLKAAWQNWLGGVGNTDQLVSAVEGAADVIISNLENIIPRMTEGVMDLINKLAEKLPGMLETLLPVVVEGITTLIESFADVLPTIIEIVFPILTDIAPDVILTIVNALIDNLPQIIEFGLELILALAEGIIQSLPDLIPKVAEVIFTITETLLSYLPEILAVGIDLIVSLGEGILKAMVELAVDMAQWVIEHIINPVKDKFNDFIDVGSGIIDSIKTGISNAWNTLVSWFDGLWNSLFGNRTVNVSANTSSTSHASGLDYVPYNNYPALLHEGEAVLTSGEAESWRKGKGGSGNGITIVQNISAIAQTPVELASATAAYFEQARWAI